MEQTAERPTEVAMFELLFEVLKQGNAALRDMAAEVLTAMAKRPELGKLIVHNMVTEAVTSKRTKYRVRLLQAVGHIGEVFDFGDYLSLLVLAAGGDSEVRDAAVQVTEILGPYCEKSSSGAADTGSSRD